MAAIQTEVPGAERVNDKERRRKLASLSFSEKIRLLEKLRERSLAIAASGLRKNVVKPDTGRGSSGAE
jgi:hypothetical protein